MLNKIISFLSLFSPEVSHSISLKLLKFKPKFFNPQLFDDSRLYQHLWGYDFKNPIGLAAGYDKNAKVVSSLLDLGFGFVEAGTVTPLPQKGNKKPRVFRLVEDQAIINHLGFNNLGVKIVKKNLMENNINIISKGIIGINIGQNKDTQNSIEDYCYCFENLGEYAHYVAVNISSPNTPGLRELQKKERIDNLVKSLHKKRNENQNLKNTPILFKIAPDIDDDEARDIALSSLALGIDGLIISNTTIKRHSYLRSKNQVEIGGLSGKPLFLDSTILLKKMYNLTNGQIPLIGVGGISSGSDFYEKIKAGASLVQLYTALIYQGPSIIYKIKKELINCLVTDGFKNISEAVGKET